MTFDTWWLFVGAVFLLSGTPGPNMLHVMSRSVELGLRRCLVAIAGCLLAVILILTASAAGLATLLLALPGAFDVLRYAGAAYLLFLGIKAWRSPPAPTNADETSLPRTMRKGPIFRAAFAVGISNPKLILFAAAFLPQFVDPASPQVPQFAILVATFAVIETLWFSIYAAGGRSLARYINRPTVKRVFDRVTGVIFIGFGLALLKAKPA